MKSVSVVFFDSMEDEPSLEAIASINGFEVLRVSHDFTNHEERPFEIAIKNDDDKWITPEDDGQKRFETYQEACNALMEYLQNEVCLLDYLKTPPNA